MITNFQTTLIRRSSLFPALTMIEEPTSSPLQACRLDYGFDINEEELGREMLAFLPACLISQQIPEIRAEEFEAHFSWFIS